MTMQYAETEDTMTREERADALGHAIQAETRHGWRVASQTDTQAQLVKGKPTNHLLHLVLTLLTLGLWSVVWLLTVILAGEKHELLVVNEHGAVRKN